MLTLVVYIVLAAVLGSFCNMLIYRLNNNVSLLKPSRSFCPSCQHSLAGWDLIPLLSFVFLKGQCRYCGEKINIRYFMLEAIFVLFAIVAWANGISLIKMFLFISLISAFFADLEKKEIPYLFLGSIALAVFLLAQYQLFSPVANLIFLAIFCLFIFLLSKFYYKREVFGGADIILFFTFALYFPFKQFLLMFYLSFLLGALIAGVFLLSGKLKKDDFLPFAPFIILSFFIVEVAGSEFLTFYFKLLGQ